MKKYIVIFLIVLFSFPVSGKIINVANGYTSKEIKGEWNIYAEIVESCSELEVGHKDLFFVKAKSIGTYKIKITGSPKINVNCKVNGNKINGSGRIGPGGGYPRQNVKIIADIINENKFQGKIYWNIPKYKCQGITQFNATRFR